MKFALRRGLRVALAPLAVTFVAVALAACSDPFALKASYANEPFTFSLYALTSKGPLNAPSALDLTAASVVRADGTFGFDVAFDLDSKGKVLIYPQKLVGSSLSTSRTVGLQRVSGTYESLLIGPSANYQADSILAVNVGEPVAIRLTSSSCTYQLSTEMYAKIVIDSLGSGGLMFGRGVFNPNCGFRSFADGIPDK
jgi:hypothetical protein